MDLRAEINNKDNEQMNEIAFRIQNDIWPVLMHNIDHGTEIVSSENNFDASAKNKAAIRKMVALNIGMKLLNSFGIEAEIINKNA